MLGNAALIDHMLKRLKLRRGQVSADGAVSVDLTSCTGMCDQGPAMLVNNFAITRLTRRRIDEICDLMRHRRAAPGMAGGVLSTSTTTSAVARPC